MRRRFIAPRQGSDSQAAVTLSPSNFRRHLSFLARRVASVVIVAPLGFAAPQSAAGRSDVDPSPMKLREMVQKPAPLTEVGSFNPVHANAAALGQAGPQDPDGQGSAHPPETSLLRDRW